jgi:dTDP-4-amino-4,6-dideoxygalactose transaminase
VKFAAASPVHAYVGTGFGQKYRMHPFAAAVGRQQLKRLDEINAQVEKNVKAMNQHLAQLEAVTEPRLRSDQKRVYYNGNLLFVDFKKLGVPRAAIIKALKAEGVAADFWDYPEQHKLKIYAEAKWWHHPPKVPESMPGNQYVNANHIFLPAIYGEAPDLVAQYVKAFQKVWAQKSLLAKS